MATVDPNTLPLEAMLEWARLKPDAPWLLQPVEGRTLRYTWRDAVAQVRRMAAALQAQGWPPGSRIAISGLNTAHWFLADFAILMAGHVPVGLYPKQAAKITRYVFEHSDAKAVFLGPMSDAAQFVDAVPDGVLKIRMPYPAAPRGDVEWDAFCADVAPLQEYVARAPDAMYLLIYTSGTTGDPKGVVLTAAGLQWLRAAFSRVAPQLCEHERLFSYLPLAHFLERLAIENGSLLWGAEVHFLEAPERMGAQLAQVAPTRFMAVPLVWLRLRAAILQKMPQRRLDRLLRIPVLRGWLKRRLRRAIGLDNARFCLTGAAPIPADVLAWFSDTLGIVIQEGYGPTESGAYASLTPFDRPRFGAAGKPMADAGFRLADDGEIQLKHPGLMAGYYRDPERTRESFTADGWLRTGDKGRVDDDGYLFITGRIRDIFKTLKGKYVVPAPIESALARDADIDQLCLVGRRLTQPVMLVTLTAQARAKPRDALELQMRDGLAAVNAALESHERIAKVCVARDAWTIDNGLMTPTMKIRRDSVEDRYGDWVARAAEDRDTLVVWES
jgi:long-chain acyl-CoA synthetase